MSRQEDIRCFFKGGPSVELGLAEVKARQVARSVKREPSATMPPPAKSTRPRRSSSLASASSKSDALIAAERALNLSPALQGSSSPVAAPIQDSGPLAAPPLQSSTLVSPIPQHVAAATPPFLRSPLSSPLPERSALASPMSERSALSPVSERSTSASPVALRSALPTPSPVVAKPGAKCDDIDKGCNEFGLTPQEKRKMERAAKERFRRSLLPAAEERETRSERAPPEVISEIAAMPSGKRYWMMMYLECNCVWSNVTSRLTLLKRSSEIDVEEEVEYCRSQWIKFWEDPELGNH